ncbi:nanoRNase/pAp phosphatase, hydrolyzes c-di-AMP and oligoRNAs [Halorientalis persicus]|uniref:NanoRNase/pAp phosphatase, hydrolyzes c-di-AMP and oligoRNAs n=1 Tax=Halorientalis persicus TaxID=1367881 RepID=A0A1H8F508_9EURY|nr:bifunctional oligoribonuclease/PAP phosphatase NrnA [Halorientalis persicus]SEN26524.1 nanoRNase/pAp phosphatase, hydrolyzes c-di-AMP and oligoRNAs [Halorientalis persicus]
MAPVQQDEGAGESESAVPRPATSRIDELASVLADAESLGIVCHDDPDPDSIASALALELLAEAWGVPETDIVYGGSITHQQNRAFVNLLDLDLTHLDETELDTFDCIAFVDHSIPGVNNSVPASTSVDVVIDHHDFPEPPEAEYVDVRDRCGATASILVGYLTRSDVPLSEPVASALLFALHRERLDYVRHPTAEEYQAALTVFRQADVPLVEEMYGSAFTPAMLDAIGEAIRSRTVRGSSLVATVGRTSEGGAIPQAADYLLNLEGITTVLVFGLVDETVRLSARSIDSRVDIADALRVSFADVGQVGGHSDMAGGQIPLGLFADHGDDDPDLLAFADRRVRGRFFDAMHLGGDDG